MRILLDTNVFCTITGSKEAADRFIDRLNTNGDVVYISEPILTESMEGYKNDNKDYIKRRFSNFAYIMGTLGFQKIKYTRRLN